MQLFPNENKVLSSDDDGLILTNQRIYMKDKVWGQSYIISIFLEDISSMEVMYKSYIIFIILGAATILFSLYVEENQWAALSLIFFLLWWFTRKHTITIKSDGGSPLFLKVGDMSDDRIEEFVYKVSLAKSKRMTDLNRQS